MSDSTTRRRAPSGVTREGSTSISDNPYSVASPNPSEGAHTVAPTPDPDLAAIQEAVAEATRWFDVVGTYAGLIERRAKTDGGFSPFWRAVNETIRERWSARTLEQIKKAAWTRVEVPRG